MQKPTIYTQETHKIITRIFTKVELQFQVNNVIYTLARGNTLNFQNHCRNKILLACDFKPHAEVQSQRL